MDLIQSLQVSQNAWVLSAAPFAVAALLWVVAKMALR